MVCKLAGTDLNWRMLERSRHAGAQSLQHKAGLGAKAGAGFGGPINCSSRQPASLLYVFDVLYVLYMLQTDLLYNELTTMRNRKGMEAWET